ncbi:methyltransferase type 11 [Luminiphilus syltensis NOR5-1B]|uniref:Methyltransferase type 11 n=1 Tax=Luminiphilus syltensis NOR5-1B TaxID=565045 RepID=B8KUL5_9GAMM|nr:methyltransferase type 11 [Luminiphilus syltensis NOR5-1B]
MDFGWLALGGGQRCLDLGCGEGRHTLAGYLRADVDMVGVDLASADLLTARSRIGDMAGYHPQGQVVFFRADALRLPFPDASFDRIICSEVLEHIPNYLSVIEEIDRLLKPGGRLCISVPRAWPEQICWWLSREYRTTPGGHIRIFRRSDLCREVERQGFRYYHGHGAHALHVPYWWLRCLFWRQGAEHWLVNQYHRLLVWELTTGPRFMRWIDRFLNPFMGKSVVMYFKKVGTSSGEKMDVAQ